MKKQVVELLTDFPNMVPIQANYYASVNRADEGGNPPPLPEPSVIMNAPNITPAAVDTAKGPDALHLHTF